MVSRLWLIVIILAIPVIGFAVSEAIQAHSDSELHSALHQQFPNADQTKIEAMTVDVLCNSPSPELADLCSTNANLNLMSRASVAAGIVGLSLLLVIWLAGALARGSRRLLLYVFKPGLYLTGLVLIALIATHAVLAMSAIYYGESELIGRIHFGIIAAIGLGALGGVVVVASNTFSVVKKAEIFVIGTSVSRTQAPELWGKVEQVAQQMGALHPESVVLGLDPNFFVTEADVVCLTGRLSGRTLYCSLPLSRILTVNEFSSIIGHELGHFKGQDTKFSERFYPIYRGTASSIASLQATGGDGSAVIALLPAIAIFSYFLESFSIAESRIGRERELSADREGAKISDAETMATALVKVHAFSGVWQGLQQQAAKILQEGKAFVNASKTYADTVRAVANAEVLNGIAELHLSHPTDSHPPLGVRLKSFGIDLASVSKRALEVTPDDAATTLIAGQETLEEEVSDAYQAILARQLGIELNQGAVNKQSCMEFPVCEKCGQSWDPRDYQPEADHIFCFHCKAELRRPTS